MGDLTRADGIYTAPPRHLLTTIGGSLGVVASLPFVITGGLQVVDPVERAAAAAARLDLPLTEARAAVVAVGVVEVALALWGLGLALAVLRRRPASRLAAIMTYVAYGAVGAPIALLGVLEGVTAGWIGLASGLTGLLAAGVLSRHEVDVDVERAGFARAQRRKAGAEGNGVRRRERSASG